MSSRVVVTVPIERIVTVTRGDTVIEIRQPAPPRVQVLTFGYQGPRGVLDGNVLQRVEQARADADFSRQAAEQAGESALAAEIAADEAVEGVSALMRSLQSAFEHHAGAISAADND